MPGNGQPITYDFIRQLVEAANKTKETVIKTNVPDEIILYTNRTSTENPNARIMIHIGHKDISGFDNFTFSPKYKNNPVIIAQGAIASGFDKNDQGVNVTIGNITPQGFDASVRDLGGKAIKAAVRVNYIAIGYPA